MVKACKLRSLKPQRQTELTYAAEQARCNITGQQLDCRTWAVAFGDEKTLKRHVVDANVFMNHREDCVLGFSDQVPWWGMINAGKQLFA